MEQIYNTPPGSSSSEKLQALHSPYGIMPENSSLAVNTFDTLNQFAQESIIVPFESHAIADQFACFPTNKLSFEKSSKRYEPSKASAKSPSIRQQRTPRSLPTPTLFSPARSNDWQPSPYPPNRSIGSIPTTVSPMVTLASHVPEVDSFIFNVLLDDSILNLHRDTNFDSCVLCACRQNELSIHGVDSTVYLDKPSSQARPVLQQAYSHQQSMYAESQAMPSMNNACYCGFSAVVNLRLGCSAGLFYEDECEISGTKYEVKYRQSDEQLSVQLLELIERTECLPSPFDHLNKQTSHRAQKAHPADALEIWKRPFHQCKL